MIISILPNSPSNDDARIVCLAKQTFLIQIALGNDITHRIVNLILAIADQEKLKW